MSIRAQDDGEIIADINVTPLVDIVLVLLIILMVTASYIVSQSIPMELPTAANSEEAPAQTLTVSIEDDGDIFVDAEEVSWDGLSTRAAAFAGAQDQPRAVIAADRRVPHGDFIRIVDLLRGAGITRYAINVSPDVIEPSDG